mmetsp:Transcript_405/g.1050  ORF Transcript_405/g.1050 Transcript_405/m.1050 type:complete len:205 (-) Transcript_405:1677-2291(-)
MLSHRSQTQSWFVMRMTVVPWRRQSPRMRLSKISRPTCASMADSGSSKITTSGRKYAARASATRCFCPPLMVMPRSPTCVASPATKDSMSCSRQHALMHSLYQASSKSPRKMMFSRTESFMMKGCCATKAVRPPTKVEPLALPINPRSAFASVVLPLLTLPTTASSCPGSARTLMSVSVSAGPLSAPGTAASSTSPLSVADSTP